MHHLILDTDYLVQNFDDFLLDSIKKREQDGLLRQLTYSHGLIDFSSNDYLGFAQLPILQLHHDKNLMAGGTGSRLISGNTVLAEETEKLLANFHHAEAALIFNTGYMANVGLFSCLAQKDDTYISDEYIHASIIDGMRLNYATRLKFRHNDLLDLEDKLKIGSGRIYVAVESIYSMDGDLAPLAEIAELCEKYQAALIVDEAHATGVYGENGEGLVSALHLENKVWAKIHTFGKALGLHGAAVLGSYALRQYLINHARAFIYTTAPPPHLYQQIKLAYQLLPQTNRKHLFDLIAYFKEKSTKTPQFSFLNSNSAIQGIILPDNNKIKALASYLQKKGFYVKAILSPTVPAGTERIRICLHSFNSKTEIDDLYESLNNFKLIS